MIVFCPECRFSERLDERLLPLHGLAARCPMCNYQFALSRHGIVPPQSMAEGGSKPAGPQTESDYEVVDEDRPRLDVINIVALLFLVDATLSLLGKIPMLSDVISDMSVSSFPATVNYLYDTLCAAVQFVAVFGLFYRKKWAWVAILVLISLGLVEGGYSLLYQYLSFNELEAMQHESFAEERRQLWAHLVGWLLYLYFLIKLSSHQIRARFS